MAIHAIITARTLNGAHTNKIYSTPLVQVSSVPIHRAEKLAHMPASQKNEVIEIRTLYEFGLSSRVIGRAYGVSKTAILYIVYRRNWTHVP